MTKTFVPSVMLLVVLFGLLVTVAPAFAQRGQMPSGPEQMGQPMPGDIPTEDAAKKGGMSMTWIIIIVVIALAAIVFAVVASKKGK